MLGAIDDEEAGQPKLSAAFLSTIVDHIAHPVFVKDRSFRFVFVNVALADLVGVTPREMIGKTDYDFFSSEHADFFRHKDKEMFATEAKVHIDEELINDKDGTVRVITTTKVPLRDAAGLATHVVGIIKDITDLKLAEESLRRANDELESRVRMRTQQLERAQEQLLRKERLAALGQLAGGVAHQIRNPLASIQNAASVIRRQVTGPDSDDVVRAAKIIDEEVWRADRIITDLLDYGRVHPPRSERLALVELLQKQLELTPAPTGVDVATSIADDLHVLVDEQQLAGALGNVFRNAFEAMPEGGRLTLDAKRTGKDIVLRVADTGPGLDAVEREQVFEPLVTNKPFGLGLGLAIARAFVTNQGGSIRCLAPPGGGCCFEITLPAA